MPSYDSSFRPAALWICATTAVCLAVAACRDTSTVISPGAGALSVEGPDTIYGIGAEAHFEATLESGTLPQLAWSSSDTAVLVITGPGTFRAEQSGDALVRVAAGALTGEKRVVVRAVDGPPQTNPPEGAGLQIRALGDTLLASLGDTLRLRVESSAPVQPEQVQWTSSVPAVATAENGSVVARGNGTTTISARVGDRTASIGIRVEQKARSVAFSAPEYRIAGPGQSLQLQAAVVDARGNPLPTSSLRWSSSAPDRVRVSDAGVASAPAYGSATVTAASGNLSATAVVRVVGGTTPQIQLAAAGLTARDLETTLSYLVFRTEFSDTERDLDSIHVVLLDASGARLAEYHNALAQGDPDDALRMQAIDLPQPATVHLEVVDAAGHRSERDLPVRTNPTAGSPELQYIAFERVGADSIRVEFDVADAERDADAVWLVGWDEKGGWTLFDNFSVPPADVDWSGEVGVRTEAVARTARFGILVMDREGHLSRLRTSTTPAAGGASSPSLAPRASLLVQRGAGVVRIRR